MAVGPAPVDAGSAGGGVGGEGDVRFGWWLAAGAIGTLGGCGGSGDGETPPTDTDADTDADTDSDTDADTDSDTDADSDTDTDADSDTAGPPTADTAAVDPCAPDASLTLTAVPAIGRLPNQLLLTVDASADTTVAASCVSDTDATDAHLVEGQSPGVHHELHFMGLLSATDYTCKVAATCPTTGAPAVVVQHRTGAPPVQFSVLDVEVDPVLGMTGHYTMAPWQASLGAGAYVVVWGPDGKARWWERLPDGVGIDIEALLDPGTTQIVWGGGDDPDGAPTVTDLWSGELYKAALPTWGPDQYTHDTKRIADGRILSLQYVPNRQGARGWQGFGIRVHDPATGLVDFEFDSQRYVDEGRLPPANGGEPYHANWIQYEETPGGPVLYVSLYELQHIMAIDGVTGDLIWDLTAGTGWVVEDAAGNRLPDGDLPQGQHGCQVEGDRIWVYDNGVNRLHSRAERWRIDGVNRVATREWMWTEPGWFEPILGDIDPLPNDRVLLTEATLGCCLHPTDFVEVDVATGRVASRLSMPSDANLGYRSERYDGCDLFANVGLCAPLAARATELEPLLR